MTRRQTNIALTTILTIGLFGYLMLAIAIAIMCPLWMMVAMMTPSYFIARVYGELLETIWTPSQVAR